MAIPTWWYKENYHGRFGYRTSATLRLATKPEKSKVRTSLPLTGDSGYPVDFETEMVEVPLATNVLEAQSLFAARIPFGFLTQDGSNWIGGMVTAENYADYEKGKIGSLTFDPVSDCREFLAGKKKVYVK